jgi:phage shock protein C
MDDQDIHKELFDEQDPEFNEILPVKKLQRSGSNIVVAGVCAGLADYFKIEIGTLRVSFLLSLLLGNWPVIVYLIIAFLLPVSKNEETLTQEEKAKQRKENSKTVLSGILMLLGLHFALEELGLRNSASILVLPNGFMFPTMAIATGVFLLTNRIPQFGNITGVAEKFVRVKKGKMISGVCIGLANYIGIDAASIRIIFIILSCLTLGIFALVYILIALFSTTEIMPVSNE